LIHGECSGADGGSGALMERMVFNQHAQAVRIRPAIGCKPTIRHDYDCIYEAKKDTRLDSYGHLSALDADACKYRLGATDRLQGHCRAMGPH
jgi:hypothetical protein